METWWLVELIYMVVVIPRLSVTVYLMLAKLFLSSAEDQHFLLRPWSRGIRHKNDLVITNYIIKKWIKVTSSFYIHKWIDTVCVWMTVPLLNWTSPWLRTDQLQASLQRHFGLQIKNSKAEISVLSAYGKGDGSKLLHIFDLDFLISTGHLIMGIILRKRLEGYVLFELVYR